MGFHKTSQTIILYLRSNGNLSVVLVDNSCLQGRTFSVCEDNVNATVDLLQSLSFTIFTQKN